MWTKISSSWTISCVNSLELVKASCQLNSNWIGVFTFCSTYSNFSNCLVLRQKKTKEYEMPSENSVMCKLFSSPSSTNEWFWKDTFFREWNSNAASIAMLQLPKERYKCPEICESISSLWTPWENSGTSFIRTH